MTSRGRTTLGLAGSLCVGAIVACGAFSSNDDEPLASTTPDGMRFPDGGTRDPAGVDGAGPGQVPDGLTPATDGGVPSDAGPCKLVFVTETGKKGGDVNGLAAADTLCTNAGPDEGPGPRKKKYVAWLGTENTKALSRLAPQAGARWCQSGEVDATATAESLQAGNLLRGITKTAAGASAKVNAHVWTGTNFVASIVEDCNDWQSNNDQGTSGTVGTTTTDWTFARTESCGATNLLYCFEK